eukprot:6177049-Pleurochrysis_carterae.AAC.1
MHILGLVAVRADATLLMQLCSGPRAGSTHALRDQRPTGLIPPLAISNHEHLLKHPAAQMPSLPLPTPQSSALTLPMPATSAHRVRVCADELVLPKIRAESHPSASVVAFRDSGAGSARHFKSGVCSDVSKRVYSRMRCLLSCLHLAKCPPTLRQAVRVPIWPQLPRCHASVNRPCLPECKACLAFPLPVVLLDVHSAFCPAFPVALMYDYRYTCTVQCMIDEALTVFILCASVLWYRSARHAARLRRRGDLARRRASAQIRMTRARQ